jgi:hypothetical protein
VAQAGATPPPVPTATALAPLRPFGCVWL